MGLGVLGPHAPGAVRKGDIENVQYIKCVGLVIYRKRGSAENPG